MKTVLFNVIAALYCFTLVQCEPKKQTYHFHFFTLQAEESGRLFTKLKIPDKISGKSVYLQQINYKNEEIVAEQGPNEGRKELLISSLQFSLKKPDNVQMDTTRVYYDPNCKVITFLNKMDNQTIASIRTTSIQLEPIEGLEKIQFSGNKEAELKKGSCYQQFNKYEFHDKELKSGLFLLHFGHTVGDPRTGFNGIPIQEVSEDEFDEALEGK